jgi:hypothetical protein
MAGCYTIPEIGRRELFDVFLRPSSTSDLRANRLVPTFEWDAHHGTPKHQK